jgi:TonB family protein
MSISAHQDVQAHIRRPVRRPGPAVVCLIVITAMIAGWPTLNAAPSFHAARYRDGSLPSLPPPTVVAGGEVMLELTVTSDGAVRDVKTLRTTPPYTDAMIMAAKTWRFMPAEVESDPVASTPAKSVESSVLVVGIFRPPTLNTPTLGELPRDVGTESDGTPFPIATVVPLYPLRAQGGGLVLIETTVDSMGRATQNRVIRSSPPFDEPALDSLRQWTFRPARGRGTGTAAFAYVVFGFREPVTTRSVR